MTCEKARELISEYIDNELAREEAEALFRHVAGCPSCRAVLEDYKKQAELLGNVVSVPEGMLAAAKRKAKKAEAKKRTQIRRISAFAACFVVVAVCATAISLIPEMTGGETLSDGSEISLESGAAMAPDTESGVRDEAEDVLLEEPEADVAPMDEAADVPAEEPADEPASEEDGSRGQQDANASGVVVNGDLQFDISAEESIYVKTALIDIVNNDPYADMYDTESGFVVIAGEDVGSIMDAFMDIGLEGVGLSPGDVIEVNIY